MLDFRSQSNPALGRKKSAIIVSKDKGKVVMPSGAAKMKLKTIIDSKFKKMSKKPKIPKSVQKSILGLLEVEEAKKMHRSSKNLFKSVENYNYEKYKLYPSNRKKRSKKAIKPSEGILHLLEEYQYEQFRLKKSQAPKSKPINLIFPPTLKPQKTPKNRKNSSSGLHTDPSEPSKRLETAREINQIWKPPSFKKFKKIEKEVIEPVLELDHISSPKSQYFRFQPVVGKAQGSSGHKKSPELNQDFVDYLHDFLGKSEADHIIGEYRDKQMSALFGFLAQIALKFKMPASELREFIRVFKHSERRDRAKGDRIEPNFERNLNEFLVFLKKAVKQNQRVQGQLFKNRADFRPFYQAVDRFFDRLEDYEDLTGFKKNFEDGLTHFMKEYKDYQVDEIEQKWVDVLNDHDRAQKGSTWKRLYEKIG